MSHYTHQTHIRYQTGLWHLQWNGPRGSVLATLVDSDPVISKEWDEEANKEGKALMAAMQYCRHYKEEAAAIPDPPAPRKPVRTKPPKTKYKEIDQ